MTLREIVEYMLAFCTVSVWPAVALIIFFALRGRLLSLFDVISSIRVAGIVEIDLDPRIRQAATVIEEMSLSESPPIEMPPEEERPEEFDDRDPRIAIIESWASVEASIEDLAEATAGGKNKSDRMSTRQRIELLKNAGVIDGPLAGIIYDMRAIRNIVAHGGAATLHESSVQQFIRTATNLESIVEGRKKDSRRAGH